MKLSHYSTCITTTGTHVTYEITQCYLPPSTDDIPLNHRQLKLVLYLGYWHWRDARLSLPSGIGCIPIWSPIPGRLGSTYSILVHATIRRYDYAIPANQLHHTLSVTPTLLTSKVKLILCYGQLLTLRAPGHWPILFPLLGVGRVVTVDVKNS